MPNVRYNLNSRKESASVIYLVFRYNRKRMKYSTGIKVPPRFWSDRTGRVKQNKDFPQYKQININLDRLEHLTLNIYRDCLNRGYIPSIAEFKERLSAKTLQRSESSPLLDFVRAIVEERKASGKYAKSTIVKYRSFETVLQGFCDYSRRSPTFDEIDLSFFNAFTDYLFNVRKINSVTAEKWVKVFKVFLAEATERGKNRNLAYQSKHFNIKAHQADKTYLNKGELSMLENLDLSRNKRLDRVRDLFLFGCFTGLRFSDIAKIKPENFVRIRDVSAIRVQTKKTGSVALVPVHPVVERILSKYDGLPPKQISNQKMNRYLKELAELAGMVENVLIVETVGGNRKEVIKKRCELITTHTARRSFITNALKSGITEKQVMDMTGIKDRRVLEKYNRISKEESAIDAFKRSEFWR
jgi:integrase